MRHPRAIGLAAAIANLALLAGLAACASTTEPGTPASEPASERAARPPAVPEVRPGVLAGYLPLSESPDSLALLPPPPAPGTAAMTADLDAHRDARALRGTPRWTLAAQDADLSFPNAAGTFSCAAGAAISESQTPYLYQLLRRSLADGGLATYAAKNRYRRVRPFAELKEESCTPQEEARLATDGSYPSGHAAIGWTWALLLAELAPDRDDAILARGYAFGQSRLVCGVHWQSDVAAGRVVAAGVVARLHAEAAFRADLEIAGAELAAARTAAAAPTRDCAVEATALDTGAP
jgi:acid phosphatase (class A)